MKEKEFMTYKLEPGLSRITSPISLLLPDGTERRYESGRDIVEAAFDHRYVVTRIRAVENMVELKLEELIDPATNWIGEEQSFF